MNTDKGLVINHFNANVLIILKSYVKILAKKRKEEWEKNTIEKLIQILLNEIYDIRHTVIVNRFLANPENRGDLKRMIPRICHEETIISEENIKELIRIFNQHTSDQTSQREIFKIKKLYEFNFKK